MTFGRTPEAVHARHRDNDSKQSPTDRANLRQPPQVISIFVSSFFDRTHTAREHTPVEGTASPLKMELKPGLSALVTGGASGIGESLSRVLLHTRSSSILIQCRVLD